MESVFIVEGWSDDMQLRTAFPGIITIVTNGTKVNNRVRRQIKYHLNKGRNIYILSDPDEAGDQLAGMLWRECLNLKRIEVDPTKASYFTGSRMRYGVEYMSRGHIIELLSKYIR